MRAGQLNKIIEIYAPSYERSSYGELELTYYKEYETRAQVIHNSGNREVTNDEKFHSNTKTFKVRSYVNINDEDQIKFQGKFYRVIEIDRISEWNEIIIITELVND